MRQQLIEGAAKFLHDVLIRCAEILVGGGQPSPSPPKALAAADTSAVGAEPASNGKTRRLATR